MLGVYSNRIAIKGQLDKMERQYKNKQEFEASLDYARHVVENEGFDYAFSAMTDFPDIDDEGFHQLRLAFLKARDNLCRYLNLDDEVSFEG